VAGLVSERCVLLSTTVIIRMWTVAEKLEVVASPTIPHRSTKWLRNAGAHMVARTTGSQPPV